MKGTLGKPRFFSMLAFVAMLGITTFLTSCDNQTAVAGGTGAPKLEVVGGDTVNWGDVGPKMLERAVRITNAGGDTLRISRVKPSCGCTTAPLDKEMLLPGDTATIKLTMDVVTRTGPQTKTLTIFSNDTANSHRMVYLMANVVRDIVSMPEYFPVIDRISPGEEGSATVRLENRGEETITLQPPALTGNPLMVVAFDMNEPKTLRPGESVPVTATVRPMNTGTSTATVSFKTDSERTPEVQITLSVHATVNHSES